jgi:hypothetical protein
MRLRGFYVGRGQWVAAVLLLLLLGECCWSIARRPLGSDDYRYAFCGREMWERPTPVAGYFTTCGNLHGDGTLAYRVAGLPLTIQRLALLAADHFRKPEDRLYSGGLRGSEWELRHQLGWVKWLLRLPFCLFAVWLGGGLWWDSKRLFGLEGGAIALALYCFCPAVVRYATTPNNEILALWGLYGLLYTAIGVAHALQGPRYKWKPRIVLLTVALGLTAAAHLLAAMLGFLAGAIFLLYLAERRRRYVMQILIPAALGAMLIVFVSFGLQVGAFTYVFSGGSARFWFGLYAAKAFFHSQENAGIGVASAVALLVYLTARRSRYFGNTAPLLMTLVLLPLYTTQVVTAPWVWALPFLFTFVGGVFADVLESRQRKLYLLLSGALVALQAALCGASIAGVL